jgi:outer membrane receptor for ferrienterochelin and colicin
MPKKPTENIRVPRLLSLTLLICITFFAFQQEAIAGVTGKIAGIVKDSETGELLPGANIILEGTEMGAAADVNGEYYVINVPPGIYSVTARMMGYKSETKTQVRVSIDRTTWINFDLESTPIEVEGVTVVAERPIIEKDLTSSMAFLTSSEIERTPVENIQERIRLQRGVILGGPGRPSGPAYLDVRSDYLHIRGGRDNETVFMLGGMRVNDVLWGGSDFIQSGSGSGISEMTMLAGTFNAEYGGGMSGVISVVPKTGDDKFQGEISGYTGNLGTYQGEFNFSGPIIPERLFFYIVGQGRTTDGYKYGYIGKNWKDSEGAILDDTFNVHESLIDEEVSMDYNDNLNGMANLLLRITPDIKLLATGAYSNTKQMFYNHDFKYNPYGNTHHTRETIFGSLKFVHAINPSTFYELGLSRIARNTFMGVWDEWEDAMINREPWVGPWNLYGEPWDWGVDTAVVYEGIFSVTSQITPRHYVKLGGSYRNISIHSDVRNPNQFGEYTTFYDYGPYEYSAYIQDKIEFPSIGMIINAGMRFDAWDVNINAIEDHTKILDTVRTKTLDVKTAISPRLGVSYPILDIAAFHFAYGHFYQFPSYGVVYQWHRYESPIEDERFPVTYESDFTYTDPDVKPEKTISYEAGIQVKFTEDVAIDVTAFYRTMSDLLGTRYIEATPASYRYTSNFDYGNAKGVEVVFKKRFSEYWSMDANYTYTKATTTGTTAWSRLYEGSLYRTFTAGWDRPHAFSFDIYVGVTEDWGIGASGSAKSGLPYTRGAEPNNERMPPLLTFDVQGTKYFDLLGQKVKIFARILNVFDRRNIYDVYTDSGNPDAPLQSFYKKNVTDDPNNYGPPRQWRVGMEFSF